MEIKQTLYYMQDKDKKTLTMSDLAKFRIPLQMYKAISGVWYTDGMQYLAIQADAYWLIDLIGSVQAKLSGEEFQRWILKVSDGKAEITCDDGNDTKLYSQQIAPVDFPFEQFKLYVSHNVLMLTSEY
jgi:hypothetical protein